MILLNDSFVAKEKVCISFEDRGYYFGDGVYEVFRIYNGTLYEKKAHLERLERSCREIKLVPRHSITEIEQLMDRLLTRQQVAEGTLYLQITRGNAPRSHTFPERSESNLLAYVNETPRPTATMKQGITAITRPDFRWLRCDIKSLNLLPNTMLKQEAIEHGADESILHREGTVTECSASNLMIVVDGAIYTHPANELILHGVTRAVVLQLAEKLNIPIYEQTFSVEKLKQADEVFITGTTVEVTPVISIDQQAIHTGKPGEITRKLQAAFETTIPS